MQKAGMSGCQRFMSPRWLEAGLSGSTGMSMGCFDISAWAVAASVDGEGKRAPPVSSRWRKRWRRGAVGRTGRSSSRAPFAQLIEPFALQSERARSVSGPAQPVPVIFRSLIAPRSQTPARRGRDGEGSEWGGCFRPAVHRPLGLLTSKPPSNAKQRRRREREEPGRPADLCVARIFTPHQGTALAAFKCSFRPAFAWLEYLPQRASPYAPLLTLARFSSAEGSDSGRTRHGWICTPFSPSLTLSKTVLSAAGSEEL